MFGPFPSHLLLRCLAGAPDTTPAAQVAEIQAAAHRCLRVEASQLVVWRVRKDAEVFHLHPTCKWIRTNKLTTPLGVPDITDPIRVCRTCAGQVADATHLAARMLTAAAVTAVAEHTLALPPVPAPVAGGDACALPLRAALHPRAVLEDLIVRTARWAPEPIAAALDLLLQAVRAQMRQLTARLDRLTATRYAEAVHRAAAWCAPLVCPERDQLSPAACRTWSQFTIAGDAGPPPTSSPSSGNPAAAGGQWLPAYVSLDPVVTQSLSQTYQALVDLSVSDYQTTIAIDEQLVTQFPLMDPCGGCGSQDLRELVPFGLDSIPHQGVREHVVARVPVALALFALCLSIRRRPTRGRRPRAVARVLDQRCDWMSEETRCAWKLYLEGAADSLFSAFATAATWCEPALDEQWQVVDAPTSATVETPEAEPADELVVC